MMETLASAHKVQRMCQAFKVSRSGYYKYLHQGKEGKRNKENAIVLLEMMNIWLQSRRVYGSPLGQKYVLHKILEEQLNLLISDKMDLFFTIIY